MDSIFYHASNIGNIKELLPISSVRKSGEKVCYFSQTRAYALFYLRDMEINHVTCNVTDVGTVVYHEQFPNQLKTIYQGRSGYIYTCENNNKINALKSGIWITNQPIAVKTEEYIEDVYDEILKGEEAEKIKIIRYESLSDEKKNEIIEMMRNYIIKNDLLNKNSKKSHFWRDNFPQSWEIAKTEKIT